MHEMPFSLHETDGFRYLDETPGPEATAEGRPSIILLHGMLGALSNWTDTVRALTGAGYRTLAPILPVYELPLRKTSVSGLVRFTRDFVEALGLDEVILVGNSLGGHVALLYALDHSDGLEGLVLSAASGIYEVTTGTSTPKRRNREFVRERTAYTFYDPAHATEELVDEMYDIINDRPRVVRLIKMARSAKQETVTDRLGEIDVPTLLVWGRNDKLTPPDVAEEFLQRMPRAELHFIDKCGHAPMMEHPHLFNEVTIDFLDRVAGPSVLANKAS